MGLNSCLYECRVTHTRLSPKRHHFSYRVFMFYLDLDELAAAAERLSFFSLNRWNLFSFHDRDHLEFDPRPVKEKLTAFLESQGVRLEGGRILLLTYPRVLGYVFNPVSFFVCLDEAGSPRCVVAEVGNTFGERKLFFIGPNAGRKDTFNLKTMKYFYVSPFMGSDIEFEFRVRVPGQKLEIHVDDFRCGEKLLAASLTGEKTELSDFKLLFFFIKYPLVTLKVIGLIHWNALLLYLKKIRYHRKADNPSLQRGVIAPR